MDVKYLEPTNVSLTTINGGLIRVYGKFDVELKITELRRSYSCKFVVADIQQNVIGLDFFIITSVID